MIAEANEDGFGTEEILAELGDLLQQQQMAYDADPDPAEDPEDFRITDVRKPDATADIDAEEGVPRAG
jgi:hypothetical protein